MPRYKVKAGAFRHEGVVYAPGDEFESTTAMSHERLECVTKVTEFVEAAKVTKFVEAAKVTKVVKAN